MKLNRIRLKIVSSMCDNVYYITIADHNVHMTNKSETLIGLSSITEDAVALRCALETASNQYPAGRLAKEAVEKHCKGYIKSVEIFSQL